MKVTIQTQGRQFTVREGNVIFVNRYCDSNKGDKIKINTVLYANTGSDILLGNPYIEGAYVEAIILENKLGPKIHIFKKNRRKGYERRQGHRQVISVIKITNIKLFTSF